MDRAVSWPASRSPPSPRPHVPTPTRLLAGIAAIWSSGPTSTTSAASGACASAAATTSGPMPRGSPSVTARRGRCACGPDVVLEADVDVGLAADQIQVVLDREVLAQVGADAVLHILEGELPFGQALGDLDDGELGAQPRGHAQLPAPYQQMLAADSICWYGAGSCAIGTVSASLASFSSA